MAKLWTKDEDDRLRELAKTEESIAEIARAMGRPPPVVRRHGKMLGIDLPRGKGFKNRFEWTEERLQMMRDLSEQGATAKEARQALGCSKDTIYTKAREMGLKFRNPNITKADSRQPFRDKVLRAVEERRSARDIAAEYGISKNAVIGIAHRAGLRVGESPAIQLRSARDLLFNTHDAYQYNGSHRSVEVGPPPKQCQWIDGHHSNPVCGAPVLPGKSYCEEHYWRVYRKPDPKDKEVQHDYSIGGRPK